METGQNPAGEISEAEQFVRNMLLLILMFVTGYMVLGIMGTLYRVLLSSPIAWWPTYVVT